MDIKSKIKSAWQRIKGKRSKHADSELGADEVIKKEVFPKTAKAKSTQKTSARKNGCTKKKPSERTRPTNNDYQMIDPDNDTFDAGKS